ncbi:rhodanese-like domain-containing protein [Rhizobium leguminosarum]|uniref:rhodanese-like domain-containing protein n=1 Tax=Rhizobium leguminosarum TaxID=384 RepID=UPI00103090F5|nr:rhodanese-like domain-containing protein [Rhizobium leguminosarum]TAY05203.1 sulfurtransferase [Rhizobium leguminosarum]
MVETAALPKEKQTILGLYITAAEAYKLWEAAPETVKILDVRTPEEFLFVGHPAMAWNIPIALQTHEWDPTKTALRMKPTTDFVTRVKEMANPSETILATCRSGGRGAMAVNMLAKAGFSNVYNIVDGVEGDLVEDAASVFHGKRMKNGWKNAGLPWAYDLDSNKMLLPAIQTEAIATPADK